MPDTSRRLAGPFPLPEETRPTGQTTFKNDVLLVVPVSLTFANGIGRRNQPSMVVIGVGNNTLLSHPDVGLITLCPLNLVVHRNDAVRRVPQKQRASDSVRHPLDTSQIVPGNTQSVAIRIANGR